MSGDLEGDLNQDGIIDEMDRVRGELDGQIDELGTSVRNMFDWQNYVRAAPLTSVGAAVVVGYLLAPRIFSRAPRMVTIPASAAPAESGGIMQSLFGMVLAGAARAGTAYLAEMLSHNMASHTDSTVPEADNRYEPPFDVGV